MRSTPDLPTYEITSWQTNFPELQQALDTKGGVMNVFSVIILIIAGIGILNLLLMAVMERTREIGLLGALGMKPRQISWLFVLEGALIGLGRCGVRRGVGHGDQWLVRPGWDGFQQVLDCEPVHRPDQWACLPDPGDGKNYPAQC